MTIAHAAAQDNVTPQRDRTLDIVVELLENRHLLSAAVVTDKPEYVPGETAQITGTGFVRGETVQLQVLHTDDTPNTGNGHTPWVITDGGEGDSDGKKDGNFATTWYVDPDDSLRSKFIATATGVASAVVGTASFWDAAPSILLSSILPDGTKVDGVVSLRNSLLRYSDQFVRVVTEKLLTYALGRGIEYQDMPMVRTIAREAAPSKYSFSSLVMGIVKSDRFQMNQKAAAPDGSRVARNE